MEYYLTINQNGDVGCVGTTQVSMDGFETVQIETEEGIDYEKLNGYKYVDGELVFDEDKYNVFLVEQDYRETVNEQQDILKKMQTRTVLMTLDDSQAYSVRLLFDEWNIDIKYVVGDRVMFENKFYKCLKEHTSNDALKPTLANYLWVEISDPNDEWPEWKQPLGYADAYKKGDKVTFNGKKYESLIDGNTYSPEVYPAGWKLVE